MALDIVSEGDLEVFKHLTPFIFLVPLYAHGLIFGKEKGCIIYTSVKF